MEYSDRYNNEKYLDMTAYLAIRNIERSTRRMREDWVYRRGDIYLANLDPYIGSEQGGTRPVVVLQNNAGNFFGPTLIVAPITSKSWKKRMQPTHYILNDVAGLDGESVVLLEQITTIDKCRVKKYLGKISREQMAEVDDVMDISLGRHVPETVEFP